MNNMGTKIRVNMAYIASLIMVIGVHLPLYITSKGNHIGLVYRTNQEGLLLLISAALAIIQKYNNRIKHLLGPVIFQIGIIIYYIIHMFNDKYFVTASWGMILQVCAVLLLIFSMCVGKLNDDEFTHDMSTMRIVKTDEYEYNENFILKDSVWIVAFIVLTTGLILFKVNSENKNLHNTTENLTSNSVSASEKEEQKTSGIFDYECDDYCMGINDAYITNEDGREIVFLEVSIKNKTNKALVFNDLFELEVKQGNIKLERCAMVDSEVFDSNSGLAQISLLETSKVYIPYVLVKSQQDLDVSISSKKDKKNIISGKVVKINDLYYVDTLEEIISIGERKIAEEDNKTTKNDDKDDEEKVVETESPKEELQTTTPTEKPKDTKTKEPTEEANEVEKTSEPAEEVIPTEQAIENDTIVSGTVKFVKPSSWEEDTKVYIYIYEKEEEVVEKTRIVMSGYENGIYTFFLNKIDMSNDVYITFGNDTKLYPGNNKKLVLSMGKKYTSN